MKWFTIILAAGILALSITPLTDLFFEHSTVETSTCCSKKPVDEESDKDCSEDICNPFLACCAPVLITPEIDQVKVDVELPELEHFTFYSSTQGVLIEFEVWQPPEVMA